MEFTGAQRTVEVFRPSRERLGAPTALTELGVSVTRDGTGFVSYAGTDAIDQIRALTSILEPLVPHLSIVPEVQLAGES
jgi:hypothetical protein